MQAPYRVVVWQLLQHGPWPRKTRCAAFCPVISKLASFALQMSPPVNKPNTSPLSVLTKFEPIHSCSSLLVMLISALLTMLSALNNCTQSAPLEDFYRFQQREKRRNGKWRFSRDFKKAEPHHVVVPCLA